MALYFDADSGTFDEDTGTFDEMGQQFALSQGTATPAITVALVGIAISVSSGLVSPNNDGTVPLIGSEVVLSQGAPLPDYSRALTGIELTFSQGAPSLVLRPTDPVGQSTTLAQGTVIPSGNSVTVHLGGSEITMSQGDVTGGTQYLSGLGTTLAAGTTVSAIDLPLVGQSMTVQQGDLASDQEALEVLMTLYAGSVGTDLSVELLGEEAILSQGNVGITGDVTLPLTGEASTLAAGSVGFEESFPISGSSFQLFQETVGAPGGATLSGAEMTFSAGDVFTTNDRTYALTGQSFTIQDGTTFASPLAFVDGQELALEQANIGPRTVELVGSSFDMDTGDLVPEDHKKKGAGRPKHHKRSMALEVDGEIFDVSSQDEALQILRRVKLKAQDTAEIALTRAIAAEKRPQRKIMADAKKAMKPPKIRAGSGILDVAESVFAEIESLYENTLRTIEAAILKRKQAEEEEETSILTML